MMPEDQSDNENTDDQFADIVNRSGWMPQEPTTLQFKIVEWMAFMGITLGIIGGVALLTGAVVWVWQKVL